MNTGTEQTIRVLVYERMDPTDESVRWLESQGVSVTWGRAMWQAPYSRYSAEEIIAAARGHHAVMGASGARFPAGVIEQLPQLRFISKFGVGYETIDVEAATRAGILVSITPEASEVADVAEHTVALILALQKQLSRWTSSYMRAGGWRPGPFATSLAGKTLGLIGYGHIGRAVARRMVGWDLRVIAFDPHCQATNSDVALTDLDTLLREADIVSLHASPSPSNQHLLNARAFSIMKQSAIVINTARASLVDTDALCLALKAGHIGGAAVDVFDQEPPDVACELFQLPNVVTTPHAAAWTRQGLGNIGWHAARNLVAMATGEGHADVVNPQAIAPGIQS